MLAHRPPLRTIAADLRPIRPTPGALSDSLRALRSAPLGLHQSAAYASGALLPWVGRRRTDAGLGRLRVLLAVGGG